MTSESSQCRCSFILRPNGKALPLPVIFRSTGLATLIVDHPIRILLVLQGLLLYARPGPNIRDAYNAMSSHVHMLDLSRCEGTIRIPPHRERQRQHAAKTSLRTTGSGKIRRLVRTIGRPSRWHHRPRRGWLCTGRAPHGPVAAVVRPGRVGPPRERIRGRPFLGGTHG